MNTRSNVAIIYSEESRQAFIAEARNRGQIYQFPGSGGTLHWLQGDVAYLAVNGVASLLRRLSIKFDILSEEECSEECLREYHTVFVPNACCLLEQTISAIGGWMEGDVLLVVSGHTNLPEHLLEIQGNDRYVPEGFCSIKWLPSLGFTPQRADYILSPPGYSLRIARAGRDSASLGTLIEYREGARVHLNGDAIIASRKTIYFALPVFEYIAGILQGHICIEPLREILRNESNFYVDKLAWYIKSVLLQHGWKRLWQIQLKPWGKHNNALVLRHDTDDSADPSYLDYEIANKVPATYSILPDKNMEFYLSRTSAHDFLESSYHFTAAMSKLWLQRAKPNKKAITGNGLVIQIKAAEKKFKVPISTTHRHWSYFYYPETVEALNCLYEKHPEIIGAGTMFRFTNMMYSDDGKVSKTYTVASPNVSVPFWFPFKMVVSTIEQHRVLRGWDITHFMEPPPSLIDLVFNEASTLPGGAYMLGFHPAHARSSVFTPKGNYPWFLHGLSEAKKRGWWITNYKTLLQRLNDWEDIAFRVTRDGLVILDNTTDREIIDIVVSFNGEDTLIPTLKAHSITQVKCKKRRAKIE